MKSHAPSMSAGHAWMCSEIDARRSLDLDEALEYLSDKLEDQIKGNPDITPIAFILSILHDLKDIRL